MSDRWWAIGFMNDWCWCVGLFNDWRWYISLFNDRNGQLDSWWVVCFLYNNRWRQNSWHRHWNWNGDRFFEQRNGNFHGHNEWTFCQFLQKCGCLGYFCNFNRPEGLCSGNFQTDGFFGDAERGRQKTECSNFRCFDLCGLKMLKTVRLIKAYSRGWTDGWILTAVAVLANAIFALVFTSFATATWAMTCGALASANLALARPNFALMPNLALMSPSSGAASDSWLAIMARTCVGNHINQISCVPSQNLTDFAYWSFQ